DLDRAIARARELCEKRVARSVAWQGNAVDLLRALIERGVTPALLTDQTSAHDMLNGYVPNGMRFEQALELRRTDPEGYLVESRRTVAEHVRAMIALMRRGAVTFDYGNNIRGEAREAGVAEAFEFPGFVPSYVRPLFCEGKGPFRWVALSGEPDDIFAT